MTYKILNISFNDKEIKDIVNNINKKGFHCIENVFDSKTQELFVLKLHKLIKEKGNRYFSIINIFKYKESPFYPIASNKDLNLMLKKVAEGILNRNIAETETLNILRVVTGKNVATQKLNFHYDSYALTALIPISIPKGRIKDCGHLVAFPNNRNIRSSFFVNLIEKSIMQNSLTRKILALIINRNINKYTYIMKPGNIYLFWGYRTLHANHAVSNENLRATLLYHFGEVHKNSKIEKYIKKRRHSIENKNSKNQITN